MIIYAEHAGNNRRQFFRFLHGYQTLSKETELTSSNLNAVEKNWVPFLDQNQKPHVWRWLEDEDGYGVAHLIDLGAVLWARPCGSGVSCGVSY